MPGREVSAQEQGKGHARAQGSAQEKMEGEKEREISDDVENR
jgi:hypothetical protein